MAAAAAEKTKVVYWRKQEFHLSNTWRSIRPYIKWKPDLWCEYRSVHAGTVKNKNKTRDCVVTHKFPETSSIAVHGNSYRIYEQRWVLFDFRLSFNLIYVHIYIIVALYLIV